MPPVPNMPRKTLTWPFMAVDRWHAFLYRVLNARGVEGERAHGWLHMIQGGLLVLLGLIFLPSYYPLVCPLFLAFSVPFFVAGVRRRRKARTLIAHDEVRLQRQLRDGRKHP